MPIVVTLNPGRKLRSVLAAIVPAPGLEVFVADRGSCDGTQAWLESHGIAFDSAKRTRAESVAAGVAKVGAGSDVVLLDDEPATEARPAAAPRKSKP